MRGREFYSCLRMEKVRCLSKANCVSKNFRHLPCKVCTGESWVSRYKFVGGSLDVMCESF